MQEDPKPYNEYGGAYEAHNKAMITNLFDVRLSPLGRRMFT